MSSREADAVQHTKNVCMQRFKSTLNLNEKMAMAFYMSELSKISTVDDAQAFKKPLIGAGGYGDQEICKKLVARSPDDQTPLTKNGELQYTEYKFKDLYTYLSSIESFKNPDGRDGVTKAHPSKEELIKEELRRQERLAWLSGNQKGDFPDYD